MANKNKKTLGIIGRWRKKNELMSAIPSNMMNQKDSGFVGKVIGKSLKRGDEGGARLYVDEQLRKMVDQTKDTPVSQEYMKKARRKFGYKFQ